MAIQANHARYMQSLAGELHSQAHRIRDLIGSKHWLSDGSHKEFLLRDLLRRHSPAGVIVSRGFVIDSAAGEGCSREQDVLMVDTSQEGPIFSQGDLIVALPHTVLASISVKTTLSRETLLSTVKGLASVRSVCARNQIAGEPMPWCGGYFFEVDQAFRAKPEAVYSVTQEGLTQFPVDAAPLPTSHPLPVIPDMLACGVGTVVRAVHAHATDYEGALTTPALLGFSCGDQATAVFLTDLMGHLARHRGSRVDPLSSFFLNHSVPPLDPPRFELKLPPGR
jgi:hypothetical protein